MPRSLHARIHRALAGTAVIALLCPGVAAATASFGADPGSASSGGAGLSSPGTAPGPASSPAPQPRTQPVGGSVSTAGNGVTLSTTATGTVKGVLTFSGSVRRTPIGSEVAIQAGSRRGWHTVARTSLAAHARFSAHWRASVSGDIPFRAVVLPGSTAPGRQARLTRRPLASPALRVVIYTEALATIYGPGFYGHKTACGTTLSPSTLGVASRTLPCGTRVSIEYDGESITVAVIDRGPYANGATWDLTEATATALGDPGTESVGAAVL